MQFKTFIPLGVTGLCNLCPHWQTVVIESVIRTIPLGTCRKESSQDCVQSVIDRLEGQLENSRASSCTRKVPIMPVEYNAQRQVSTVGCHCKREVHVYVLVCRKACA